MAKAAFPAEPQSAQAARRFVASTIDGNLGPQTVEVACLLTSELVANAVLHAGTPFELSVALSERSVRVTVYDHSPVTPVLRQPVTDDAVGGRGLILVDRLSTAWGVSEDTTGKGIWFALRG